MKQPLITMLDYGGSNLRSVQKALEAVGARVRVTNDPNTARRAEKFVLPGVGAFGPGMAALRERDLDVAVVEACRSGIPLLGICLGMQFLADESEELGYHRGLGLIPADVVRFPADMTLDGMILKVPHMGWNEIVHDGGHPLLAGIESGAHAYFVHSYHWTTENEPDVLAWSEYGRRFAAVVGRDHVMGIQFHPEKSQGVGLRILHNFVSMRA